MLYPVLHTVERVAYSVLYCVREIDVFGIRSRLQLPLCRKYI